MVCVVVVIFQPMASAADINVFVALIYYPPGWARAQHAMVRLVLCLLFRVGFLLDPSVFAGVIANNRIYVTITEGVGQNRGGLLELRGDPDLVESPCGPEEFFCQLGSVPVFDPNS